MDLLAGVGVCRGISPDVGLSPGPWPLTSCTHTNGPRVAKVQLAVPFPD